jgi:formylglycine-generating enzyme required for sulfatase activity
VGEVLAAIAGEDSVDFFLRLAQDVPERREAALWALGQMGRQANEVLREQVLGRLETFLANRQLHALALSVLAEAWDAETLAKALDRTVVTISAGEFLMGTEKRKAQVGAFAIARYPVTNVQYKCFVNATSREPPRHWEEGQYPPEKALHPVVHVSWRDAAAYAEWMGGRLPTEEEWEKAARGTDGREYPWGEWVEGRCNSKEAGVGDTTPVGQYSPAGDSPYGCADMAGNVWEWTASEHESWRGSRVLRGGSYRGERDGARCGARTADLPNFSSAYYGFRCVSLISSSEF